MGHPLISIFLPYYNDVQFLHAAIESILNQTYPYFELILFNHASTDGSRNVAHSFSDKRIIHIDSSINYDAGAGLNWWQYLPKMRRGEYIKVFCADDIMLPNHLEILLRTLIDQPKYSIVVATQLNIINTQGQLIQENISSFPADFSTRKNLSWEICKLFFNSISILPWDNFLVHKELVSKIYHDNSMIYLFDMSFWASILISGKQICFLDKAITAYRNSNVSMMAQSTQRILQACYFEHLAYCNLFYDIKDVKLAKFLCEHVPSEIKDKMTESDNAFIPFLIALEYAYKPNTAYSRYPVMNLIYMNSMYSKIYQLLQDENMRQQLQERFGFTVKEFRRLYLQSQYRPLFYRQHKISRFFNHLLRKV